MIIDIHNHFYPLEYLNCLKEYGKNISVLYDHYGRMIINYKGDYNVVVKSHIDIIERLKVMDKFKIDLQILTLTTPGIDFEDIDFSVKLARVVNDSFSKIIEKFPDRFTALAVLPMQIPELAIEELKRAIVDLGLNGVIIFSNVNGKPIDYKDFLRIYEEIERLDVPIFIHPTSPLNLNFMDDYRIVPMFGFPIDTSLAVLRLILSGVLEKFSSLKIVVAHAGGVLPYLIGRIDKCFNMYPESKYNVSKLPSYYLKKNVYVDSICYDQKILEFVFRILGSNRIMLGTDYPHQITDIENAVERIIKLDISNTEKENILGLNALKLFKIGLN
ncbi:MAG: amidohydrolase [Candidatus Methanomethylicia archaeon]|nr:amidohydrolase [Candidatus Methanomethylicia archaeon]